MAIVELSMKVTTMCFGAAFDVAGFVWKRRKQKQPAPYSIDLINKAMNPFGGAYQSFRVEREKNNNISFYWGENPEILKRGKWTGTNPNNTKDHGHWVYNANGQTEFVRDKDGYTWKERGHPWKP